MNKLILSLFVIFVLPACSVLDIISPEPQVIVCNIKDAPNLPSANEDGYVILDRDNQIDLLLYIESMENCIDKLS